VTVFRYEMTGPGIDRVVRTEAEPVSPGPGEVQVRLRALGADQLINYRAHPDWEQEGWRLTGGVDVVIDVGGESTLGRSVACTNTDGFIAVIGVLSVFGLAQVSTIDVMQRNLTLKGVTVGCAESLERFCRFVETRGIEPVISHRLPAAGTLSRPA
jgi:NADPH:quinone reductase-like Zn-dependent oxidoreductase